MSTDERGEFIAEQYDLRNREATRLDAVTRQARRLFDKGRDHEAKRLGVPRWSSGVDR